MNEVDSHCLYQWKYHRYKYQLNCADIKYASKKKEYNTYKSTYLQQRVKELMEDENVTHKAGIYEFLLDGENKTQLLSVRVFDEITKRKVYARQTKEAQEQGVSNCPLCAVGHDANRTKIWSLKEMDADHVTAWSKGGATDIGNCQMLCQTHNRAKGNK